MSETTELITSPIIRSVVKPAEMKQAVEEYQQLVTDLLTPNDVSMIQGKRFIKKSGWYKLAVPFNITTEIIEEKTESLTADNSEFAYHFTVRAKVGNTRHVDEIGSCDNTVLDKKGAARHVVRTMAKTRATSRAIASIIGATEQSAEDMEFVKSADNSQGDTRPPSEAQLNLLTNILKYTGPKPASMSEANTLIADIKAKAVAK